MIVNHYIRIPIEQPVFIESKTFFFVAQMFFMNKVQSCEFRSNLTTSPFIFVD